MSCIPLKKEFMTFMFLVGSATIRSEYTDSTLGI